MHKPKAPRAYYVGGFGVGCGVPRVEILERIPAGTYLHLMTDERNDQYKLRVVSKKAYGFPFGDIFYRKADELYDHISFIQGPKVQHWGREWMEAFEVYAEATRQYGNEKRLFSLKETDI